MASDAAAEEKKKPGNAPWKPCHNILVVGSVNKSQNEVCGKQHNLRYNREGLCMNVSVVVLEAHTAGFDSSLGW